VKQKYKIGAFEGDIKQSYSEGDMILSIASSKIQFKTFEGDPMFSKEVQMISEGDTVLRTEPRTSEGDKRVSKVQKYKLRVSEGDTPITEINYFKLLDMITVTLLTKITKKPLFNFMKFYKGVLEYVQR